MTWPLTRLGSRFGLLFEPGRQRVMHSTLGRFFDQPLDLAVGLVDPDGTERVLPFTPNGQMLYAVEQNERMNSITFRGFSEASGLRFELNFHSPFYPRNEKLCLLPAIYVELRVTWMERIRLRRYKQQEDKVKLFLRLSRPDTHIQASPGRIDLEYDVRIDPRYESACGSNHHGGSTDGKEFDPGAPIAKAYERIQSINEGAEPVSDEHGRQGLTLELPVSEIGSGIKWRLIWGAHTADQVLNVHGHEAFLRYNRYWKNLDEVMGEAEARRDERLALSRRFEKLLEQAPLNRARWHLLVLAFQSFLSNTFWCDLDDDTELFTVWEGNFMYHNTLDVMYNMSLIYFALWPKLLRMSLDQWMNHTTEHDPSGGVFLHHDLGQGLYVSDDQAYDHPMPVEENSNYLLLLQAYAHWTGDRKILERHADFVEKVAEYLIWTDRDNSGFPSRGTANTLDDGSPAIQVARKQTYLAIKRVCALEAAADILLHVNRNDLAELYRNTAAQAAPQIEAAAWLEDHYAVCVDRDTSELGIELAVADQFPLDDMTGWDDYSIYTANALLLPAMTAQPIAFDRKRLQIDLVSAQRETLLNYGCGHTSSDTSHVWISQNLWRDFTSRYLNAELLDLETHYWDMIVSANTFGQSFGYIDCYVTNELAFNPRGATAFGVFLAGPRMVVDRLDDEFLAVNPNRHRPQRWPLLPLADWEAGKFPVCVVSSDGNVSIEGEIEPVRVLTFKPSEEGTIG
ncbi:MAG: glutaminase domain-containing protein [Planctomycetota bacterium]